MSTEAEPAGLRDRLVDDLTRLGRITSPAVDAAFRAVPREVFLPDSDLEEVYSDSAVVIKKDAQGVPTSSSSQPSIMAIMLEQLQVEPGQRVLEIGTGTGYNAALLAHLVGESGSVVSVDLDQDLVTDAWDRLDAAGCESVRLVCADGGYGHPDRAPYDRIIVTVGAGDLPPAWRDQLAPAGLLVLPLSLHGMMRSIAFRRAGDHLISESVHNCGFMPLRGDFAAQEEIVSLSPAGDVTLLRRGKIEIDAAALYAALNGPSIDLTGTVIATATELFGGPALWLALNEPGLARLMGSGQAVERGLVPGIYTSPRAAGTIAITEEDSIACLARPDGVGGDEALPVLVRGFGPAGESLARRLLDRLEEWERAGRPDTSALKITAYPPETEPVEADWTLDLDHARLGINWN